MPLTHRPSPALAAAEPAAPSGALGDLPEWRLEHLYPGMESAEYRADLDRMDREARDFAARRITKRDFMKKMALAGVGFSAFSAGLLGNSRGFRGNQR